MKLGLALVVKSILLLNLVRNSSQWGKQGSLYIIYPIETLTKWQYKGSCNC